MLSKKNSAVTLFLSTAFLLIVEFLNDYLIVVPQILRFIVYGSLPVAGGFITFSFCSLLGAFAPKENSATSSILTRTSEDGERNFFVGFFTVAYFGLLRPLLADNVPFLPYVEWVTVVSAIYAIYSATNPTIKGFYASSESLSWKGHIQKVSKETGQDLTRTLSLMEQFVDQGVKEPLLIYLTLHLQRIGKTEEDIIKILSPIINYKENAQKSRLRSLALSSAKRKHGLQNKKAREDLLKKLAKEIIRL